ncbi:complement factor D-like [Acipenser oxyrinchus oxyrinchus]|uniref:Complement factor D-like n=1 Tax=Acipenser oxyrinchus oxyrinchus TaxID=40147 RepID=A0AAD8CX58_ACIOX|nr:complement factor D-like [Acipenser oxyrinchus oxyrinchus]
MDQRYRLPVKSILLFGALQCASGAMIIGGWEAKPHSRPYMVSVQQNGTHHCGGFLVADQWVVSAAHCYTAQSTPYKVLLGAHSLSDSESTKQTFGVAAIYTHPDFNIEINYDNDIALLKLDGRVSLTKAVQKISYQRVSGDVPQGTVCSTAGWGWIKNVGIMPDKLQEVNVTVIGRETCCSRRYHGNRITGNMMCAGDRGKDSCHGDSGGPLLCNGLVEGITSFGGMKCGKPLKPGVYTVISRYTDWINKVMNQGSKY